VVLDIGVEREADPFGLVPTASTTATAAMGDALAIAAMVHRGFGVDDFHRNHPGGSLGSLLRERTTSVAPTTTADVCVVGSFMLDLVVATDRRPGVGETVFGESFETFLGGKGFNQAIAAARAGTTTAMVGRLGTDEFGDRFRAGLASEGIEASHVIADADVGTGVGCPVVGTDGSNAIIVVPRANLCVTPADVESADETIRSAKVLLMQLELPVDALVAAARIARHAGTLVVLNPAPARDGLEPLRGLIDVIVPNEVEAEQLTGVSCADGGREAAKALREQWGAGTVVITLGERGAYFATDSAEGSIGGHSVHVVDTVGAGDAFVGCLVAALARDDDLEQVVRLANAAGALAVTKPGAEPSMPRASEVAELLASSDCQDSHQ
jgi:ribokinase